MENQLNIISIRENPGYKEIAIRYFQLKWESVLPVIYQDCIEHCIGAELPLPQWYLLMKGEEVIGCAGLVTNDFVSRMDLYPWFCALFIERKYRGREYGSLLLEKAKEDTLKAGFKSMYLTTDHIGLYEKYGFEYLAQGYHPWGDESRIYRIMLDHPQLPEIHIRPEKEADHKPVYNLIRRAFLSAPVKDGDEQDFAEQLRNSSNYIPELAFVAIVDGKLAGHIMLTHTTVKEPDGRTYQALLLAPLSVLLEYRNHGVGSKLVEMACREAWLLGYKAVFLCGDPAYYNRFGFRETSGFDIHPAGDIPEQYVLVRELEQGALQGVSGIVTCC